jgi:hypothetical protein
MAPTPRINPLLIIATFVTKLCAPVGHYRHRKGRSSGRSMLRERKGSGQYAASLDGNKFPLRGAGEVVC